MNVVIAYRYLVLLTDDSGAACISRMMVTDPAAGGRSGGKRHPRVGRVAAAVRRFGTADQSAGASDARWPGEVDAEARVIAARNKEDGKSFFYWVSY